MGGEVTRLSWRKCQKVAPSWSGLRGAPRGVVLPSATRPAKASCSSLACSAGRSSTMPSISSGPGLPSECGTPAGTRYGGYASSHDHRLNCGLRSADRRGRSSRSRGAQRLGRATDRRPLPARKLAGDYAQFAQTCQDSASGIVNACGPGSPDSHRVVWGLTSRPPVPPAGFPPVSRLPAGFSPFARLPLVSRRRRSPVSSPSAVARFRFPFGVPPGSLPLSNLHHSAAAARFRRRWSRAARAKVTSPAASPRLDLAVIRPALQMGSGWAQWDAATESPVTSGRERRTPPRPNHPDRQGYCLLAARRDWSR